MKNRVAWDIVCFGLMWIIGSGSAVAGSRQTCFLDQKADEVTVQIVLNLSVCSPSLDGNLYTIETTDNRLSIDGCFVGNNLIPTGYTHIPRFSGSGCGPASGVTWFRNQDPVGRAFGVLTPVNTAFSGSAATIDPDGDVLSYTIPATTPKGGRFSINTSTGAFTYIPAQSFEGEDFAAAVAQDAKGGEALIQITVTVGNPTTQNRAPVFPTFTITTKQSELVGILLHADDPEGGPVTITLDQNQRPAHGTLTPQPLRDAYSYTPNTGYVGPDSFAAFATDDHGNTTRTVFPINVQPKQPPAATLNFLPAILDLLLSD
jgi:hypothetical protein